MSDINNYLHFAYDTLGRLISFWESNGRDGTPVRKIDWIYDIYGNILSKTTYGSSCPPEGCVETHTVDAANNRITGWSQTPQYEGPYTYTYDAAGNRLGSGRTYDAENRLTGYTGISFQYDGNSHRFRRVAGGTTTYYVYSARGFLLLEDNVTGGVVNNQIYFNGSLIATHDQNDCVRFYIKDHLGSTRSIVTVTPGTPWGYNWQTTAAFSYNPFGDFNSSWNNDPQSSRVRFTGKEREDNGLDYFGARYYDSKRTYRWMSPDPITTRVYDPLSLNKYSYVRNDPVNLTDPDGRSPVEFHQAFTSLLATAFGLSAEDSADLVRGAVDADDFVHGSTGLFLIGGFFINSLRHFGPPAEFKGDWYAFGRDGIHNIEDTSDGAPHDFGQRTGYLDSLWAALRHGLQGHEPDLDIGKIVNGARNAWKAFEDLIGVTLDFPEEQVTNMATEIANKIRASSGGGGPSYDYDYEVKFEFRNPHFNSAGILTGEGLGIAGYS